MRVKVKGLDIIEFPALAELVKDDNDAKAAIDYAEAQTPGRVALVVGDSILPEHPNLFRMALAAATKQALYDPDLPVCTIFNGAVFKAFPSLETAIEARQSGQFPHVHVHIIVVVFQ